MISRCAISGCKHRVRVPFVRCYASTATRSKKDLPPPLPPKSNTKTKTTTTSKPSKSPAQAKKEYLEAQKRTGEFLKDPQANIARLQADMDKTKQELLKVHNKPIWRRVVDRLKAKQHAVINLLAASMAYILAHQLHLKIKENDRLQQEINEEKNKISELRTLLRSLQTDHFCQAVVAQATNENNEKESTETTKSSSSWFASKSQESSSSSSSSDKNTLAESLRRALERKIGDEGLEDADRKQKNIQDIWQENQKNITTEEGLAQIAQVIAVEGTVAAESNNNNNNNNNSKKRVFDM